jgi:WD40 repeat protein
MVSLQTVKELKGHTHWVQTLIFSSDSRFLVSGSYDNTIRVWDMVGSSPVRVLEGHTDYVMDLSLLDDRVLASGSYDNTIRMWDLSSPSNNQAVKVIEGHTSSVWGVAFSPNGTTLFSCSHDQTIRMWTNSSPSY